MPLFGSHLSISGSMLNALDEAVKLKLDTVQVFTKNQQQWKAKPLDEGIIRDWRARVVEMGWNKGARIADAGRTVSHASYLINLASPNDELWAKSIDLMQDEIERCEKLGIPFLVHHPGSSTTSPKEDGMARIARAYAELFKRTAGYTTVSCLENTVGGGSTIGREFPELARLREMIISATGQPQRIGFCIDTCHAHAGGYDLSTAKGAAAALAELDQTCGLSFVRAIHLNDSKGAAGSRLDRHEHIGKGTIGLEGFRTFLNHPGLAGVPMILETPKGEDEGGTPHDTINLKALRKLLALSKPAAPSTRPAPKTKKPARTKGS